MPCCCVPNCDSGYATKVRLLKEKGESPPSFFKIKEKDLEALNRAIPRKDRKLTTKDYVCSEHYHEQDIIRFHEDLVIGETVIKGEKLKAPRLKDGAIPSKFKGPKYLSKPPAIKRKAPKERAAPPAKMPIVDPQMEEFVDNPDDTQMEEGVGNPDDPQDTPTMETPQPLFNFSIVKLPRGWALHEFPDLYNFVKIDRDLNLTHAVSLDQQKNMILKVGTRKNKLREYKIEELENQAKTEQDIENTILHLDSVKPCDGDGFGGFSKDCKGGIKQGLRCHNCRAKKKYERKKQKRDAKKNKTQLKAKARQRAKCLYRVKKQNNRMRAELITLKAQLKELHKQCAKLKKEQVQEAIQDLPTPQQHAVLACLAAAKRKGPNGNRFVLDWIYECLLMRIKSPKLYEHIRNRKILVLPSRTTLNRYMRKLHPGFGYQPQLFQVLKQKILNLSEGAKHGAIMVDEMKSECNVSFDRHTLKHVGMVDVGTHTPEDQKDILADHVLQVIFRPFQGDWYQTLGCFLTKGAATGPVLTKVLLEGIGMCEGAGLKVDATVTDGAHWNRNMWDQFGITPETPSCEHPMDENRRLWFFSDWCHLIKCMRNNVCPIIPKNKNKKETDEQLKERKKAALNKELETPDGTVKRQHWIALYNLEKNMSKKYGVAALTYVPNLTELHIYPSGFQRMNVKLAYQFFGNNVAAGLQWYRKKGHSELEDSEPTEAFVARVNALADSMNSSHPSTAYRKGSKHEKNITEFLAYLKECIKLAKQKNKKAFISESTDLGLLVTLQSTIELCDYLIEEVGYAYVMTARFNQDPIEQFFSNIRSAMGPNNHPTPKLYAQIHRLLSIYSLVQPPKGSNVSGVENLRSLMSVDDLIAQAEKDRKASIDETLDEIVEMGEAFESLPVVHQLDHSYLRQAPEMEENLVKFMAGFTSFRQQKIAKNCDPCLLTFTQFREETDSGHTFTKMKEIYGGYSYASNEMANLISAVEKAVQQAVHFENVHEDLFVNTLKYMKLAAGEHVGCIDHHYEVTKKIIKFYLIMRMFFIAEKKSLEVADQNKKRKALSKQSKLQ